MCFHTPSTKLASEVAKALWRRQIGGHVTRENEDHSMVMLMTKAMLSDTNDDSGFKGRG